MKTPLALITAATLAACGPQPGGGEAARGSADGPDTCNAASYAGMIGQDAVVALSIPEPKRQYRLGDPVTMDANPNRTNIVLDAEGKIAKVTCG